MSDVAKLPALRADDWEWHLSAACRGLDVNMFFNPENERGLSKRRRESEAKAVCAGCSVLSRCLEWSLAVREPHGVWGGRSPTEREGMRAARAVTAASIPAADPPPTLFVVKS